jgi:hypothetical protein
MTYTLQATEGAWFRFDRYELREGCIKPAVGATLERYRPFEQYGAPTGKTSKRQSYHALLELIRPLDSEALANPRFSLYKWVEENELQVLTWCSENGLLGVLPHRTEMVILAEETRSAEFLPPGMQLHACTRYLRTARGWLPVEDVGFLPNQSPEPGAILRKLSGYDLSFEPLSATWGRFFPAIPADKRDLFQYPAPFSDEFCHQYAEPLDEFVNAARKLSEAVEALRGLGGPKTKLRNEAQAKRGEDIMNALTAPVRQMLYHERGAYKIGWISPSLLSSFAVMAELDFSQSRTLICRNVSCRKFFVSKAPRARYCSPTCRATVQMRRYRTKARMQRG